MLEIASSLKDEFASLLNSSAFSSDSIEGWIIMLLFGFIVYEFSQKAVKFAAWAICVIFMFQVFYWLSLTGMNDVIPLGRFFKYDVMTAVAQCFVGTKICDVILWANAFIHMVCSRMWELVSTRSFGTY